MNEISNNSMMVMPVTEIVERLAEAYCAIINAGQSLTLMPSVMLWGPPGVGKSQGVRQLAGSIEANTGRKVNITDVRLLLFNPVDLRGIPTANADRTLAVWLKPKIFQMDDSDEVINILFLDEISAAPQSVQAAAYQITLDRAVGEHKLPENCIVIAAGNRVSDKSVTYKMPKALANRLCHIETGPDFKSWKGWAVSKGVNPMVTGFLSFRKDYLMQFEPKAEDLVFPTPRSWEMVSNILNYVNADPVEVRALICGCVGVGAAMEFSTWCRVYKDLPSMEDIFNKGTGSVPKSTDCLYALVSSMAAYAQKHKDRLDLIANSLDYAVKLPPDFSLILMRDYMYIDKDYKLKLLQIPQFSRWLSTKGRYLNDN